MLHLLTFRVSEILSNDPLAEPVRAANRSAFCESFFGKSILPHSSRVCEPRQDSRLHLIQQAQQAVAYIGHSYISKHMTRTASHAQSAYVEASEFLFLLRLKGNGDRGVIIGTAIKAY